MEKENFQSEEKLAQLAKEFPFIASVRERSKRNGEISKTRVVVQIADFDVMRSRASNVGFIGGAYAMHDEHDWRGKRIEYFCAIDGRGEIAKRLFWFSRIKDINKKARDIFRKVDPEKVKYLAWVICEEWWSPPSDEDSTRDVVFGDKLISHNLTIVIYKKPRGLSIADLVDISKRQDKELNSAYRRFPKNRPSLHAVHRALQKGCRMSAFLSGGGLRVVSLELNGKEVAYGEHPHVEEALAHLEEDFVAGKRSYEEVYGKKYPHYLTGSQASTSNLDAWLRSGSSFDCWQEGDEIVFQLNGYHYDDIPKEIYDRIIKTGKACEWKDNRGYVFRGTPTTAGSVSVEVVSNPEGKDDPFFYPIAKTGRAKSFWKAMMNAFNAPETEAVEGN